MMPHRFDIDSAARWAASAHSLAGDRTAATLPAGVGPSGQREVSAAGMPAEAASGGRPPILEERNNKITLFSSSPLTIEKPCKDPLSQDLQAFGGYASKHEFLNASAVDADKYHVATIRCRSHLCPHCKAQNGIRLREILRDRTDCFKVPKLVSFTVDRRNFSSPEEAYDYVMGQHFFARLLTKELGIRIWLGVLEPQEKTGDGWPHWHFLLDLSEMPDMWKNRHTGETSREKPADARGWVLLKNYVDYGRVNRLLQKWGLGSCKFSTSKKKYESAAHAINYITKYLWKLPKLGYPRWMMERPKLRMIYKSNDLNAALRAVQVVQEEQTEEQEKEVLEKPRRAKPRKPYKRIAECGYRAQIINATLGGVFGRPVYICPAWLRERLDERIGRIDKKTGKAYSVPACTGYENALAFCEYTLDPQRQRQVKDHIKLREELLLIQWDNLRKLYAGDGTADARVLILQKT